MKSLTKTSLALAIGLASSVTYAQEATTETPVAEEVSSAEVETSSLEANSTAVITPEKEAVVETAETEEYSSGLEEVVVTAQKREQNLQDTPVAISTFDKTSIDDQVIRDISDLSMSIPNVQIVPTPGGSTGATVAMRGATMINPAVTMEPAVGIYIDGVFVAKNVGGLFDVAELERIEVLRGPQGTLYGKNTTAGAINLVTRKPAEEFGGWVKAGAGNEGYTEFSASVDSGRIADVASFNVAYSKRDRDGFYDNSLPGAQISKYNELDTEAGRISALFDVTDALEILYSYDWAERDNTAAMWQFEMLGANGKLASPKRLDSAASDGAGYDKSESSGHSLNVTYDITEDMTLKSITAYREMTFNDRGDYDGMPITVFHSDRNVDHEQTSQEFQLLGQSGDVNYVVGAFFFTDESNSVNPYTQNFSAYDAEGNFIIENYVSAATGVSRNFYGVESTSYALFGQADWAVTDALTLTAGIRWTDEEKEAYMSHPDQIDVGYDPVTFAPISFTPAPVTANEKESWSNVSPMLVVSYAIDEDINTYAKVSQGWKAGGFNGEARTQVEAETPYDEETLTAYEIGMKARWFDSTVQTNVAIFFNDIQDLQVSEYNPLTGYSQIANAGSAETSGFELETLWAVTDGLTAFFNYGYLNSEYKDFTNPVTGVDITKTAVFAYSPESSYSIGLEYVTDVSFAELRARIDYAFTDEQFFYNDQPNSETTASEDYALLNARVALTNIAIAGDNSLEVGVWGKNLTDEEYRRNGIPAGPTAGLNYYGDPRTVGGDVTYKF